MNWYIPLTIICALGMLGFVAPIIAKRRSIDLELDQLKRNRKIRVPDDPFHISLFNLQLCVSCDEVHTGEMCPKCGSEIHIPLRKIVHSIRELEFPIKRTARTDNVIHLPIPNRAANEA